MMKRIGSFFFLCTFIMLFSQSARAEGGIASLLRSDGKIWLVFAVILVVFLGLGYAVFRMNGRLSKIIRRTSKIDARDFE